MLPSCWDERWSSVQADLVLVGSALWRGLKLEAGCDWSLWLAVDVNSAAIAGVVCGILISTILLSLFTELGHPVAAAGLVSEIHRLAELALGGNAVEGKCVDSDGKQLDTDFNECTNERPILIFQSALGL